MDPLEEIQQSIERLSEDDRAYITGWLTELMAKGYGVAEPRAVYGAAVKNDSLSVEEFLELDGRSALKYEYVCGEIYAMAQPTRRHEMIAGNLFAAFHAHLRGGPCKPFMLNPRVRLRVDRDDFVYRPDIMIGCKPIPKHGPWENPRMVVEVLSVSTQRIDRREKAINYRHIPALEEIVLVAQSAPNVTIYRRSEQWAPVILTSLEESAELRSIELSLPLARIYEDLP